jgi:hypothetical protein
MESAEELVRLGAGGSLHQMHVLVQGEQSHFQASRAALDHAEVQLAGLARPEGEPVIVGQTSLVGYVKVGGNDWRTADHTQMPSGERIVADVPCAESVAGHWHGLD